MDERLYKFKKIIRECSYDNTYKMALAKALTELSYTNNYKEDVVRISTVDTAWLFLKYYWNQTIFFDLIQGSNIRKPPYILQYTKDLIEEYYRLVGIRMPVRYEKAEEVLKEESSEVLNNTVEKIAGVICKDVAWRFTHIDGGYADELFVFDKKEKAFIISKQMTDLLKENCEDLFDLINYRWGLILETFNSSPRINKKVKIIDQNDVKRNSLTRFKVALDIENPERRCFICNEKIEDKELSIDHVIPWSYLYSDDLWNLVYVHKSCNSIKSNAIPSREEIEKLKKRNKALLEICNNRDIKGKQIDELRIAIDKDYVEKFWIGCKL